ncbi:uncharacterized protein LOC132740453 [Ruditapes philippinarum]|uniref:uncharacterized protein LOC132740453 n=1 Tax=Ruditapes philippinarum TaxID=129788 RepID=UPI00295B1DC9|nr:uncharacterized protein LOC132740453 [Ruditapes philippinarum]
MAEQTRTRRGRFASLKKEPAKQKAYELKEEHSYVATDYVEVESCKTVDGSWKEGRRVVDFAVLLEGLRFCKSCRLGPIPLTIENVIGELKKGLGGYLKVKCLNSDCGHVNCIAYGKLVKGSKQGATTFAVNTKLGTAMIDTLGGPNKVNNMLAALNIPTISNSKLKKMERRAGSSIEKVASESMEAAGKEAFQREMEDIAVCECLEAEKSTNILIKDLGVSVLPEASPMKE